MTTSVSMRLSLISISEGTGHSAKHLGGGSGRRRHSNSGLAGTGGIPENDMMHKHTIQSLAPID